MTDDELKSRLSEDIVKVLKEYHSTRAEPDISVVYELKVTYNATRDRLIDIELERSCLMGPLL